MRDYGKIATTWWTRGPGKALRGDADAQLVAVYLCSCPSSTMLGLFYLPLPTVAHETGLPLDDVRAALTRLATLDIAHYDEAAELVWIPGLAVTEIGEDLAQGDNRIKGLQKALAQLGAHRFRDAFFERYAVAFNLVVPPPCALPSKALPSPLPPPPKPLPSQNQDQDQKQDQKALSAGARTEAPQPEAPARHVDPDPDPAEPKISADDVRALAASRPGDTLLGFLALLAAEDHPWGAVTAARVLERGGRMTEPEKKRLREIRDERAQAARSPPRGAPAVQQQPATGPLYDHPDF